MNTQGPVCNRCGREVLWVKTASGKRAPMTPWPEPGGSWQVDSNAIPAPTARWWPESFWEGLSFGHAHHDDVCTKPRRVAA